MKLYACTYSRESSLFTYVSTPPEPPVVAQLIKEPSREKTALCIEPDQPKHAAQANPDRHFSPHVDFLLKESLLYTSIPLSWNV